MTVSSFSRTHIEVALNDSADINARVLYEVLRLRAEVLVVEQRVPYMDLDGLDLADETRHVWAYVDYPSALGCVRLIRNDDGELQLGRLCTSRRARGRGIARRLVTRALQECGDETVVTHVHSHLAPWYESFGFRAIGPMFHELGIPHRSMRLQPSEVHLD